MNETKRYIEGKVTHLSERDRNDGQGKKWGIRVDDPNFLGKWVNGFGSCPFKKGDIVAMDIVFNEPFWNMVTLESEDLKEDFVSADKYEESKVETKDCFLRKELVKPEIRSFEDKVALETWRKTILEQNRAILMSKAVDLAVLWKSESLKPVKSIFKDLMVEADQTELNLGEIE